MSNPLTGRRTAVLGVTLVAVLTVAASCSSSTDDAESVTTSWSRPPQTASVATSPDYAPKGTETEAEYADAFITGSQTRPDPTFVGVDFACVAPKWVEAITLDAFYATGITPDTIREDPDVLERLVGDEVTAGKIVDAVPACGVTLVDLFIGQLGVTDPAVVDCIHQSVTEEQVRVGLVAAVLGEDGPDALALTAACRS